MRPSQKDLSEPGQSFNLAVANQRITSGLCLNTHTRGAQTLACIRRADADVSTLPNCAPNHQFACLTLLMHDMTDLYQMVTISNETSPP